MQGRSILITRMQVKGARMCHRINRQTTIRSKDVEVDCGEQNFRRGRWRSSTAGDCYIRTSSKGAGTTAVTAERSRINCEVAIPPTLIPMVPEKLLHSLIADVTVGGVETRVSSGVPFPPHIAQRKPGVTSTHSTGFVNTRSQFGGKTSSARNFPFCNAVRS